MEKSKSSNACTLIIIGNGFDLWQGINTAYSDFENYYHAHRDEILKQLHIKPFTIRNANGEAVEVSDVEMIYGDPFRPDELKHEFWNSFEDSLGWIDDQRINLYFGKDKKGLKRISKLSKNAIGILQTAFSEWIAGNKIEPRQSGYIFPENCFVINFNYTDTLEKRFGVSPDRDYHIHGEAADPKSIIVGHSKHPEYPLELLGRMKGRFKGLYYVEKALYETDKHVDDNLIYLYITMSMAGVMPDDIADVYIIGHSFGEADFRYFKSLANVMAGRRENIFDGIPDWQLEFFLMVKEEDILFLNLEYACNGRKRRNIPDIPYPELEPLDRIMELTHNGVYYELTEDQQDAVQRTAVKLRAWMEQAVRDALAIMEFDSSLADHTEGMRGLSTVQKHKFHNENSVSWNEVRWMIYEELIHRNKHMPEKELEGTRQRPMWHISYYSECDMEHIEEVMKRIEYDNYQLCSSIDECIKRF